MRIAVIGTGGIGGSYGAALAKAGANVTFVARGAHLSAIRENGLRVEVDRGETHIPPAQATDDRRHRYYRCCSVLRQICITHQETTMTARSVPRKGPARRPRAVAAKRGWSVTTWFNRSRHLVRSSAHDLQGRCRAGSRMRQNDASLCVPLRKSKPLSFHQPIEGSRFFE
jgi:hypothetical protein